MTNKIVVSLIKSPNQTKKFSAIINSNKIDFGSNNSKDYVLMNTPNNKWYDPVNADIEKENYTKRHSALGEDWGQSGIMTAGFWAKHFLWNKKTYAEAIKSIENNFNIKIVNNI